MALLQPQQIQVTGTEVTYSAPNTTDTAVPGDRVFWHVKVGATATQATVVVPGSQYGQARPDVVVAGLANEERMFGPLVPDLADPSTGVVTLQVDQTAGVTVALVRI